MAFDCKFSLDRMSYLFSNKKLEKFTVALLDSIINLTIFFHSDDADYAFVTFCRSLSYFKVTLI